MSELPVVFWKTFAVVFLLVEAGVVWVSRRDRVSFLEFCLRHVPALAFVFVVSAGVSGIVLHSSVTEIVWFLRLVFVFGFGLFVVWALFVEDEE